MTHIKNVFVLASLGVLAPDIALSQELVAFNALPAPPILPAVTVHASRFEETSTAALPQTTLVTEEDIRNSGAVTVSDILTKVVGLSTRINLDGSTNAVVDMRGYGDTADNNVVILLDGVRLSENEQASARTSMIPVEIIDHIEVHPGGNSVLYGDGATGGTINIVTKKNLGEVTVVSGGLSSYAGYQNSLFHSRELGASQLSIFGKGLNSDGYREGATTKERSAGLNWTTTLDATSFAGVRLLSSRERNTLPGPLPSTWLNTAPTRSEVPGYQYGADANVSSITVFGGKKFNNVELLVDMSRREKTFDTRYRYNAIDVYSGYSPTLSHAPLDTYSPHAAPVNTYAYGSSSFKGSVESFSPRIKISDFGLPNNSVIAGVDRVSSNRDMTAALTSATRPDTVLQSASQTEFKSQGVYVRDDWKVTSQDRVTLGYRSQHYSAVSAGTSSWTTSGSTSASEIQYSRHFHASLVGYVRAGQNFRLPNVDDNSSVNWDDNGQPILLVPQVSHDMDMGVNYRSAQWLSELKLFTSNIKHEIAFDPSANWNYGGNVNYDPTRREGVSIRQAYRFSPVWDVRLNLHHVKASFAQGQYAGNIVPNTARNYGNVSLGYQWSGAHKFTMTSRFSSDKYASGDFLNNQDKIAGYIVHDLSYGYRQDKFSLIASVNNILNKHYTDLGVFKPVAGSGDYYYISPYNMTVYPNPGRNVSLIGRFAF